MFLKIVNPVSQLHRDNQTRKKDPNTQLRVLMKLTGKPGSWDHQTFSEAAHTYAQELKPLHNSSNILPSKTLSKKKNYSFSLWV